MGKKYSKDFIKKKKERLLKDRLDSEKQIKEIRIVGPARAQTQVEILKSDLSKLGLNEVPLRISGDITDTPGIFIDGPKSGIAIDEGLIIAKRHIHVSPEDAQKHHLTEGSRVSAKVLSSGRIIEHLNVRIKKGFTTVIHIDKDEALKFGVGTNEETEIIN